jgi:hypothetical protein
MVDFMTRPGYVLLLQDAVSSFGYCLSFSSFSFSHNGIVFSVILPLITLLVSFNFVKLERQRTITSGTVVLLLNNMN